MIKRFRDWFRSLSTARRNAVLGGGLAMLIAIALLSTGETPASTGSSATCAASDVAIPPGVTVPVMPGTTPRRDTVTPQYAWAAADSYLRNSSAEGEKAIGSSVQDIVALFEECHKATPRFAEAVLAASGKLAAANDMVATVANEIARIFDHGRVMEQDTLPAHVRNCFFKQIVNEARLRQAFEAAVKRYTAALGDLDSRLLVEPQADIPDLEFDATDLPDMSAEIANAMPLSYRFDDTTNTAAKDLFISTGKYAASWIGSDLIIKGVMGNTSFIKRVPGDLAINVAVDKALDAATDAAGYKPAEQIAEAAHDLLNEIYVQTLMGDTRIRIGFLFNLDMSEAHPDPAARAECGRAARAIDRREPIGLGVRLHRLNVLRLRRRAAAIYRHIFGQDASLPLEIQRLVPDPSRIPPADQVIDMARKWVSYCGEDNR